MHIEWAIVLASVFVGFTVGLTGMGGGALMTPILLIFFGISPTTAVSSDLVAAMVMKPIGGGVHIRRKTVRWELVRWLCVGSIPMAFAGVFILHSAGDSAQVEHVTKTFLGFTLLLAATAMVFKAWLQGQRSRRLGRAGHSSPTGGPIKVKALPTLAIGALGGLLVGLTSVGSGSIIIICLMLLYPNMRGAELVGTDLVQAVPLVTSAAIAHIIVGDFELGLTTSILIGAVPAVWVGARLSSKAPDGVIRPAPWSSCSLASALKLLGHAHHHARHRAAGVLAGSRFRCGARSTPLPIPPPNGRPCRPTGVGGPLASPPRTVRHRCSLRRVLLRHDPTEAR